MIPEPEPEFEPLVLAAPAAPAEAPLLSPDDLLAWPFNADAAVLNDHLPRGVKTVVMLVDLTGLDWSEIEPLLAVIIATAAGQDMVPVLVIDRAEVLPVRRTGLAYDVLPDAAANAALDPDRDWPAYVAACRQLLAAKWQPGAIVHLGTRAVW